MAVPTAATFKARHARFATVADATVDLYLAEAGRSVDDSVWAATDYDDGVMYLAAHLMWTEGALDPTGPAQGTAGTVKRQKAGEVEIEYHPAPGGDPMNRLDGLYQSTIWGRRYLELAGRNGGVGGPAVLVV